MTTGSPGGGWITRDERLAAARALVAAEPPAPRDAARDDDLPGADGPGDGRGPGTVGWLQRLCRTAARALPADGVGVSVMTTEGVHGVAAVSDPVTDELERLQITLGEGPCRDAFATRQPVLVPDLADGATARWPAYCAAAQENGARAVFAFPLQVGAARLGVLDLYRAAPGMLSAASLEQALTFAEITVETLLNGQERALNGRAEATLDRALDSQFLVYQAQGMTMIDLGVSLADAMARLQAYAFAHDRPLQDVARDVVAGKLHLEPDSP